MARQTSTTKATAKSRRQWARMAREKYLSTQLSETHDDIEGARAAESWQAVGHLRRQALLIRRELDELAEQKKREAAQAPTEEEQMSDEELMRELLAVIAELPDAQLDDLFDAILARRTPPPDDSDLDEDDDP